LYDTARRFRRRLGASSAAVAKAGARADSTSMDEADTAVDETNALELRTDALEL
jgi:hypothetical protein